MSYMIINKVIMGHFTSNFILEFELAIDFGMRFINYNFFYLGKL